MVSIELINELQLLQNSRANKFAGEMTDKILSSVNAVNERVASSWLKRGRMLLNLEKRLDFKMLRKLKAHFLK